MPSFRDGTPLPTSSLPASADTEPAGRPVRTRSARAPGFLIALPSTFRPPRISAIASVSILALWLLMIRHLAVVYNVIAYVGGGRKKPGRLHKSLDAPRSGYQPRDPFISSGLRTFQYTAYRSW